MLSLARNLFVFASVGPGAGQAICLLVLFAKEKSASSAGKKLSLRIIVMIALSFVELAKKRPNIILAKDILAIIAGAFIVRLA